MHRALTQYMLDTHTDKNGYTEMYVPYLVNSASLYGTSQLPKIEMLPIPFFYESIID